ncbi:MAG: PIN domain-containing protein [Gammaproteobacteria bacterium]|nr:PIN domain-containing protein [Gammaproteobacteria bacterium]NIR85342.1 PIN domain-containing protein [Gammaproteobacteria bacterium]NIU06133.1 PIN domain-containing protein [Gammaproteobacteria bacterium]NIV53080.1 PIN domain-containing protein [Gammaproteobacteria bacterium]NIX87406.1 PIN domain-containing protein [Gammaproteobacteria bacterium]
MILVDLNVLLDVVQQREPHYRASAGVLEDVIRGKTEAALPGHAITTLHYLIGRYQDVTVADESVDWLLRYFTVAPVGRTELLRARSLGWSDFEDAVVAAAAESLGSDAIVTRNVRDFSGSPVRALTPEEYLLESDDGTPST